MAYERLNLQDFIDTITAANLSHIEDGIVNNETKVKTVESTVNSLRNSLVSHSNDISNLLSKMTSEEEKSDELMASEVVNSVLPLWHTLLSYGGEKIFPPTISFDGNIIGKPFLPLPLEGDEVGVGYVRIGDDIGLTMGISTCGGLYHALISILLAAFVDSNDELENFDLSFSNAMGANLFSGSVIVPSETYEYGNDPVCIYDSPYQSVINQFFSLISYFGEYPSLLLPSAFSIDRSFEYNDIVYPAGFYSLYIDSNIMNVFQTGGAAVFSDLPLFYIDKFWTLMTEDITIDHPLKQLNMPLNYSKASNAFECFGESIYWSGNSLKNDTIIPLDHPNSSFLCISYNPQTFLQAIKSATNIIMIDENNNSKALNLQMQYITDDAGIIKTTLYSLGNIIIAPTMAYDGEYCLLPGVYWTGRSIQSFELQFEGVDTQKLFNPHQINHQYLPEVPEFNLGEMGMANVPLTGDSIYLQVNTTKLKFCSKKGPVRIIIPTDTGDISCVTTFNSIGSDYQSVITGYYNGIKFDTVIVFTDNTIMVAIIPVSQMA